MIGGQVDDIEGEKKAPTASSSNPFIAPRPALCCAPVYAGRDLRRRDRRRIGRSFGFGEHIGLAFQIVDDMLDVEESSGKLGKTAGKDAAQQKITFPAVYGLEHSRQMAEEERLAAHAALRSFDDRADRLRQIADFIVRRKNLMKQRLDVAMLSRQLVESREKAQALILSGKVTVNGQKAEKPGHSVAERTRALRSPNL